MVQALFWRNFMSNQHTQKNLSPEEENDATKFKDIEEAIQKAIKSESSKLNNSDQNRKVSSAK